MTWHDAGRMMTLTVVITSWWRRCHNENDEVVMTTTEAMTMTPTAVLMTSWTATQWHHFIYIFYVGSFGKLSSIFTTIRITLGISNIQTQHLRKVLTNLLVYGYCTDRFNGNLIVSDRFMGWCHAVSKRVLLMYYRTQAPHGRCRRCRENGSAGRGPSLGQ
jgi:hypothetical protein